MIWKRLDTPHILEVKYYPEKLKLKARLRSGYYEIYAPISEARYDGLLNSKRKHDTDTFFINIIKPSRVSGRASIRYRVRRFGRYLLILIGVLAILGLLGLWNSETVMSYIGSLKLLHS